MATQLEQYYKWRVITFFVFGAILLSYVYVPQIKKMGLPALLVLIGLAMLGIYYFQFKSGYDPRWYYNGRMLSMY
jgi:hypothetical protein